jgi:hypothetical protein
VEKVSDVSQEWRKCQMCPKSGESVRCVPRVEKVSDVSQEWRKCQMSVSNCIDLGLNSCTWSLLTFTDLLCSIICSCDRFCGA